jgi:prevent-host-death family protein
MEDIPAPELSDDVSGMLRRVEAGERLRITVSGHPVAELVPLPARQRSVRWEALLEDADRWRADPGLAGELRHLL